METSICLYVHEEFCGITPTKIHATKFTRTGVNFSILCVGKPIENQAKQSSVMACLVVI